MKKSQVHSITWEMSSVDSKVEELYFRMYYMIQLLLYHIIKFTSTPHLVMKMKNVRRRGLENEVNFENQICCLVHGTMAISLLTWKCFVLPGVAETGTFLPWKRVLMVELFPTFG